jgi:hypothetical protein
MEEPTERKLMKISVEKRNRFSSHKKDEVPAGSEEPIWDGMGLLEP